MQYANKTSNNGKCFENVVSITTSQTPQHIIYIVDDGLKTIMYSIKSTISTVY